MRYVAATRLLVGGIIVLLGCGLGADAARAAEAKTPAGTKSSITAKTGATPKATVGANDWRYVAFEGRWWYWLPEKRWVYWQNNRWNDFTQCAQGQRATYTSSQHSTPAPDNSTASQDQARPAYGHALSQMYSGPAGANQDEVRPFYGHAQSRILYGPSSDRDQIGPFYGNALPGEVFGYRSVPNEEIRPFYGHAGSSFGY
jgi:hypothetical protein